VRTRLTTRHHRSFASPYSAPSAQNGGGLDGLWGAQSPWWHRQTTRYDEKSWCPREVRVPRRVRGALDFAGFRDVGVPGELSNASRGSGIARARDARLVCAIQRAIGSIPFGWRPSTLTPSRESPLFGMLPSRNGREGGQIWSTVCAVASPNASPCDVVINIRSVTPCVLFRERRGGRAWRRNACCRRCSSSSRLIRRTQQICRQLPEIRSSFCQSDTCTTRHLGISGSYRTTQFSPRIKWSHLLLAKMVQIEPCLYARLVFHILIFSISTV